MPIGGKVMKTIMVSSMGRQEIRKGMQQDNYGEGGREDEESPGHDRIGDTRYGHHVEDAGHDNAISMVASQG
jgi:hypothetical protein